MFLHRAAPLTEEVREQITSGKRPLPADLTPGPFLPPAQKAYSGVEGYLGNPFHKYDASTGEPFINQFVGEQTSKMMSESYGGIPSIRGPMVRTAEYSHPPRNFITANTFKLKNNFPNLGPFMTEFVDDSDESRRPFLQLPELENALTASTVQRKNITKRVEHPPVFKTVKEEVQTLPGSMMREMGDVDEKESIAKEEREAEAKLQAEAKRRDTFQYLINRGLEIARAKADQQPITKAMIDNDALRFEANQKRKIEEEAFNEAAQAYEGGISKLLEHPALEGVLTGQGKAGKRSTFPSLAGAGVVMTQYFPTMTKEMLHRLPKNTKEELIHLLRTVVDYTA